MPKLPRVSGKELVQALQGAGFRLSHVRGSHYYLRRDEATELVVIPVHGNRLLPVGTLHAILRQVGMTVDDLVALLEK